MKMNRRKDIHRQRRGTGREQGRALVTVPDQWDSLSYLVLFVRLLKCWSQDVREEAKQ